MLEIKSKKYQVKIDGEVYELSPLKVHQVQTIEKRKDNIDLSLITELVKDSGLPEKVIDNLDAENLNEIVKLLAGKK